jgi:hypothetical protein
MKSGKNPTPPSIDTYCIHWPHRALSLCTDTIALHSDSSLVKNGPHLPAPLLLWIGVYIFLRFFFGNRRLYFLPSFRRKVRVLHIKRFFNLPISN